MKVSMSKRTFSRRLYKNGSEFLDDIRFITGNRRQVRSALRELVQPDFRERLMLVVTDVNGCRYCSYGHGLAALKAGVPQEQIDELSAGLIPSGAPREEIPALLYAQHWAERNAHPEPQATARLVEIYGADKAEAIQILLRMIRVGNMLGNQGDYILFKLSFGRIGLRKDEARWSGISG
jgi:AhpD family alkylhydroperoxidase